MPRFHLLITALIVFAVALAVACNGDDDGNGNGDPGNGATATAEPTNGDGTATPAADKTPVDDDGVVPTSDEQPSNDDDPTPASEGTPATLIDDITAWTEDHPSVSPWGQECIYNPATAVTTCPGQGTYAVDPPLTGEDITCISLTEDGEPVAITCTSQNPVETNYYEIQS